LIYPNGGRGKSMPLSEDKTPPILSHKRYEASSAFTSKMIVATQSYETTDPLFRLLIGSNIAQPHRQERSILLKIRP
jgi:hypothetical protein